VRITAAVPRAATPGGYWCVLTVDQLPDPLASDEGVDMRFAASVSTGIFLYLDPGPAGPRLFSRFLGMYQPGAWGAEAGDLYSEIWGFAEGFRWLGAEPADAAGVPGTRLRPALSLYVPVQQSGNRSTVVAGSDDLALGGFGLLGGEAATDGSWLARGELRQARFGLFAFDRQAAGSGSGLGTSGFLDLPLGLDLQGAWSRGGSGAAALSLNNLSLRVPLGRWGGLEAQSSGTQTLQARLRTNEVGFGTAGAAGAAGRAWAPPAAAARSGRAAHAEPARPPA